MLFPLKKIGRGVEHDEETGMWRGMSDEIEGSPLPLRNTSRYMGRTWIGA